MSKSRVLNIDYSLAPEHPFHKALEDSFNIYNWLLSIGILSENIIMGGDSSGGGLVLATLIKLRDSEISLPIAAFFLSPWIDLALKGKSMKTKQNSDPMVNKEILEFASKLYLNNTDPMNTLASPLYANLKGLPHLFIQVGTSEILLDDSIRLAHQAESDGVKVDLRTWNDMIHVFGLLESNIPEVQQANKELIGFIKQYFQ